MLVGVRLLPAVVVPTRRGEPGACVGESSGEDCEALPFCRLAREAPSSSSCVSREARSMSRCPSRPSRIRRRGRRRHEERHRVAAVARRAARARSALVEVIVLMCKHDIIPRPCQGCNHTEPLTACNVFTLVN